MPKASDRISELLDELVAERMDESMKTDPGMVIAAVILYLDETAEEQESLRRVVRRSRT